MASDEGSIHEVSEGSEDNNNNLLQHDGDQQSEVVEESDDDEEEDECRVCRGPAEEGRPLYAPCKCSGSIGLTHQDCLTSWLAVTRGDGRCELCKTKFRFDPKYAENAPDRLPAHEVVLGLSSRAVAKWLPFTVRFLIAASLWLVVAPLITAYLYHGWMHRPSSIMSRWKRDLLSADVVSGAVIGAVIIISFLSLMSFADFLRVHWQQPQGRRGEENDDQRRNDVANGFAEDNNENNNEGGIDDAILDHIRESRAKIDTEQRVDIRKTEEPRSDTRQSDLRQNRSDTVGDVAAGTARGDSQPNESRGESQRQGQVGAPVVEDEAHPLRFRDGDNFNPLANVDPAPQDDLDVDDDSDNDEREPLAFPIPVDDEDDAHADDDADIDVDDVDHDDEDRDDDIAPLNRNNDGRANRRFDPMDPVLQDDQVELEINVALDELLGLRGPFSTLIRNLLWLLAFNATYLGIFAFVPRTVGSAVYSGLLNTTACRALVRSVPYVHSEDSNATTLSSIIIDLNNESEEVNTSFRLPDLATVTLGYLSIATLIVLVRYGWTLSHHIRNRFAVEDLNTDDEAARDHGGLRRRVGFPADDNDGVDPPEAAASVAVGMALDATVAVVKVGILLFLKMFLLPLLLGLWLDVSTMSLFGNNLGQRVSYAGSDLFSFILLHWVAGITFMLLVTVFLLQLREVAHPDLLARLIRPQEPQPDLLGNLMHESVSTHMKRMFLSLAIYAPLLMILVSVPVKILVASGIGNSISFFRLHFWHIVMPQMQIPLELIIFHLTMLALLERYKNSIGELQHHWLVFMCRRMGLTDHILPRSIEKFKLVGTKNVFSPAKDKAALESDPDGYSPYEKSSEIDTVDPFLFKLAERERDFDNFILTNIDRDTSGSPSFTDCESNASGEKVLSRSVNFIRLPRAAEDTAPSDNGTRLLPTKIGSFRLKLVDSSKIEFWQEVAGPEIPRPPEGWDDLGAGGAFVQGRWAWGKEKKSITEGGVAQRTPFRSHEKKRRPASLVFKVIALLVASWLAITITVCGIVSAPLAVGRGIYILFRIPDEYIHDPLAFVIGGCLFFPAASMVFSALNAERGDSTFVARISLWARRMHIPPFRKLLVFAESLLLWFIAAPVALGLSYEVFAVKSKSWFAGEEPFLDSTSLLLSWMVGSLVLNAWSFLASFSVFTRDFWANIGNGILEPPVEENDGAADAAQARQNGRNRAADRAEREPEMVEGTTRGWQGKGGRAARFFNVLKVVLLGWEWDAVNRSVLLDDFVMPITFQAVVALAGSSLSFLILLFATKNLFVHEESSVKLPIFGLVGAGLIRMVAFRLCMALHVLAQLCWSMRSSLALWFQAAHKVARDDRYLIGEVLMNYEPETQAAR